MSLKKIAEQNAKRPKSLFQAGARRLQALKAAAGELPATVAASLKGYDPNEARDDHGRWTDSGAAAAHESQTESKPEAPVAVLPHQGLGGEQLRESRAGGGAAPAAKPQRKITYATMNPEVANEHIKNTLGKDATPEHVALLFGAQDGDKLTGLKTSKGKDTTRVEAQVDGDGYRMDREFVTDGKDWRVVYNKEFEIDKSRQGHGIGSKVFAQQVEHAVKHGFRSIKTTAIGQPGGDYNGYYTWARFGYDSPLENVPGLKKDPSKLAALKDQFPGAKNISDLMASKQGREWWKANGSTFSGTFDLKDGSRSRQVLDAYLKAKSQPAAAAQQQASRQLQASNANQQAKPPVEAAPAPVSEDKPAPTRDSARGLISKVHADPKPEHVKELAEHLAAISKEDRAALRDEFGYKPISSSAEAMVKEATTRVDDLVHWNREARKEGFDSGDMRAMAKEMKGVHDDSVKRVNSLIDQARQAYPSAAHGNGRNLSEEVRNAVSARGDQTKVAGFDTLVTSLAQEFPDILGSRQEMGSAEGYGASYDASEKLWEILCAGKQSPMEPAKAYRAALELMYERRAASGGSRHSRDEPVPF